MINIKINNKDYQVEEGLTLIQICDMYNIKIPRFCYHDALPVVGNCRMCLIEVKGIPKPIASCVTMVAEGMEIITESPKIDEIRKSMLTMILHNHPLDCPVCDQGGSCDLQDQTFRYGLDKNNSSIERRVVKDKYFSPLITSNMTRCINCTRCIRFTTEIIGVSNLGILGRGENAEISNYIDEAINSELSGNLVDICPVGALNDSQFLYKARPWDLKPTQTIDIMDAVGSNITAYSTEVAVVKIMPTYNPDINENWIADKSRYIVDALRLQRLDNPLIRRKGKLQKTTWEEAFNEIKNNLEGLKPNEISACVGDFADLESIFALKELMQKLSVDNIDCRLNDVLFDSKDPSSYLFNTTIAKIQESDALLIIGSNPRKEAPMLNHRIRQRYLQGDYNIGVIGEEDDLSYGYNHLSRNTKILNEILSNEHPFTKILENAKKPMLILGLGSFINENQQELIALCKKIAVKYNMIQEDFNGFNVLQTSTSLINGLALNFTPTDYKKSYKHNLNKVKFLWLLGADNINFTNFSKDKFIVYQGHHGDNGAINANVVLPGSLWLEKDSSYFNLEGKLQYANQVISKVGNAKDDWKIIRKFSEVIDKVLDYNSLEALRKKMLASLDLDENNKIKNVFKNEETNSNIVGKIVNSIINNYYLTDVISNNSLKMKECAKLFGNKERKI